MLSSTYSSSSSTSSYDYNLDVKSSEEIISPRKVIEKYGNHNNSRAISSEESTVAVKLKNYFKQRNINFNETDTEDMASSNQITNKENRNSNGIQTVNTAASSISLNASQSSQSDTDVEIAYKLKKYFQKRNINFNPESDSRITSSTVPDTGSWDDYLYSATSSKATADPQFKYDLVAVAKQGEKWSGFTYERIITNPNVEVYLTDSMRSEPQDEEYERNKERIQQWLIKILKGESIWNATEWKEETNSYGYPIDYFHFGLSS
jgi:hypothetical protein